VAAAVTVVVVVAVMVVAAAGQVAEAAITVAQDWEDEALRPVRMAVPLRVADPSSPLRPITGTSTQARTRTHRTLQNPSLANTLHSTIRPP
jgi:hypothetical protein